MIAWVVEAARGARRLDRVIVATDDERIARAAEDAGADVRMTRADHPTGSDRVLEALGDSDAGLVVNLQGDEPTLRPASIDALVAAFADPAVRVATLAVRGADENERRDPHRVKIVVDDVGDALYFSRSAIPYRNVAAGVRPLAPGEKDPDTWRHVGTYGFRREALERFVREGRRGLEVVEDLEQLRVLRLGWRIRIVEIDEEPVCVDVPEDVARAESALRGRREESLR
jgi:3-deoxy-manno-octulosonate cytidylyltransferase (CMP-KDO synthetase)